MKNENNSLKQTLAVAASLIFHSSALFILSMTPMSTPPQKSGDVVTVDIQDKSARLTTQVAPVEVAAASPTPVAAAPVVVAPAPVVVKELAVKAPKVVAEPVTRSAAKPIKTASLKSTPKAVKTAVSLPEKVTDSKSTLTVAANEVETSPEVAADVDADASALAEATKELNEKEDIAPVVAMPVVKQTPKAIVEKETPAVEAIVVTPAPKAAVVAAALPAVEAASQKGEGKLSAIPATGAGDGDKASHGSPEGIPAGVISEAQLGLPVYSVKPYYPAMDKVRGFQGQADILYTVNANGSVSNIRVLKSSGSAAMDQSSVKALAYFRYHAQPKDTEVMKTFVYRLSGNAQEMPARLRAAGAAAAPAQSVKK